MALLNLLTPANYVTAVRDNRAFDNGSYCPAWMEQDGRIAPVLSHSRYMDAKGTGSYRDTFERFGSIRLVVRWRRDFQAEYGMYEGTHVLPVSDAQKDALLTIALGTYAAPITLYGFSYDDDKYVQDAKDAEEFFRFLNG